MVYPTPYSLSYSYTSFQQSQGNNSFPGTQLDADLAGLEQAIENVAEFAKSVIRSDGALNNGIVTYDSLSPSLKTAGLTPAMAWATATLYKAGANIIEIGSLYRSATEHTSGVFATDLAAGKWTLVTPLLAGPQGLSGTVVVNSTTTLSPGSSATVVNVGTPENALLNFGIPEGEQGEPGVAATIAVGIVTTLAPDAPATVANAGTPGAAVFNFGIPQGAAGSTIASNYESVATVEAATIPVTHNFLLTAGYNDLGDGGGALYQRAGSEPSHAGKIQSADGAWWELSRNQVIRVEMFDCSRDGTADDALAFERAAAFLGTGSVYAESATYYFGTTLDVTRTIRFVGGGHGSFHGDVTGTSTNVDHATTIEWTGAAGGTVVHCAPVSNVANPGIKGGGFVGFAIDGKGVADIGLLIESWSHGKFDVFGKQLNVAVCKTGMVAALNETKNVEHNEIAVWGNQTDAGDGTLLTITGIGALANTCFNRFNVYGVYKNSDAVDVGDSDNNIFEKVWVFRFGGGTGKGIRLRAHATHPCRANLFQRVMPSDGGIVAEGTEVAVVASYDNQINFLDQDNAVPDPIIGVGAKLNWKSTRDQLRIPIPPQGRLTLSATDPVMETGVSGATTIYYLPDGGSYIPIWDGGQFRPRKFQGDNLILDSNAAHTGYHQAGKSFDVFGIWNDGVDNVVLCTGPAWSSDTARGAGPGSTEWEMVDGIKVNKYAIVLRYGDGADDHGTFPARTATLLGTFRATANGQTSFTFGGAAAGGTAANLLLWNAYNRRPFAAVVRDTTDTWTHTAASTWRSSNNSAAMRANILVGLNEDRVAAYFQQFLNGSGVAASIGIGLDSTSSPTGLTGGVNANTGMGHARHCGLLGLGLHYLQALEYSGGATANFYGDGGSSTITSGLHVEVWA